MVDRQGNELRVGDFVKLLNKRELAGIGVFTSGMVVKESTYYDQDAVVVANKNGIPVIIPSRPSTLTITELPDNEQAALVRAGEKFLDMASDF